MNFKKVLAGACAGAMVLGMCAVPVFAEGDYYATYTITSNDTILISVEELQATGAATITFDFDFTDSWGGGALGFNVWDDTHTEYGHWEQPEWSNGGTESITLAVDDLYFESADDPQNVGIYVWWNAGEDAPFYVYVTIYDADGNNIIEKERLAKEKAEREEAAAEALAALQEAVASVDLSAVITNAESASVALTDAKAVLQQVEDAQAEVEKLEAALADAQAVFAALQDGDEADTATLEALATEIENLSADLAAAKVTLNEAIEAYDAATAEQLAAKTAEIEALKAEIEELKASVDALKTQGAADASAIEDLEAQIAALEENVAALEAEKADLEEQLANAGTGTSAGGDDTSVDPSASDPKGDTAPVAALAVVAVAALGVAVVSSKKKVNA